MNLRYQWWKAKNSLMTDEIHQGCGFWTEISDMP